MKQKLMNLINWSDVSKIVNSETAHPGNILGRHRCDGVDLLQAYFPNAIKATITFEGKAPLEMACFEEINSWFAVMLDDTYRGMYYYTVFYRTGEPAVVYDAYAFNAQISSKELARFEQGIHYELYDMLGAHPKVIDGVKGTQFAVWAPNALRVSVVGDFNFWDGRRHQMNQNGSVFELFIPGVKGGDLYKFEIKAQGGLTYLKSDPVAFAAELRPQNASVVTDISHFNWTDESWIKNRAKTQGATSPISVYELYLGSFARSEDDFYLNYQQLADLIIPYVQEMGYTHVEVMPVMEHPLDASWGYQVTGYYAPTSRYGRPVDFAAFIDKMHWNGIAVIMDWVPAHFPKDEHGLARFDGTCLYEHYDPRRGEHPHWGTFIYNYSRPEVSNFLIANALFWVEKYHVDGLRVDAVASMLYLDYGRGEGEWLPNMYGGNENLDAIEFLKHTNSILHKRNPDVITIAEESTAWPMITGDLNEGGLGFDLKWNMGYMNDFIRYIKNEPYFRSEHHDELIFSMIYAYSEKFMLAFSHDEAVHCKGTMLGKMPGEEADKFAALRATYAYMMMHPGKKLLFMGQDIGEYQEFSEQRAVNFDLLRYPLHQGVKTLVKELNHLYCTNPALTELDNEPEGFAWMNCVAWQDCYVTFIRKARTNDKALFVVANFSGVKRKMTAGVPWAGKYKEILNTDAIKYAGSGIVNPRVKTAKKQNWDGQDYCINLQIAPQSVAVFEYSAEAEGTVESKTEILSEKRSNKLKTLKEEVELGTYTKRAVPKKKK